MSRIKELKSELAPLAETLFRKTFDIREGEGKRAGLMFLYIFLNISTLLIIKPVSYALFLSQFGADQLPMVFMLVSVFAGIVSTLYTNRIKKESLGRLISQTLRAVVIMLLIFWVLLFFNIQRNIMLYVFFIWVAIFAVVTTSQFWVLANVIFNVREAKRLIGLIGSGAIAGGIFGGYLTKIFAPYLGSENLILIGAASIAACFPISRTVWRDRAPQGSGSENVRITTSITRGNTHPLKIILSSRHLTYLASIVGVSVLVAKFVEYQFSAIATMYIAQEDQLTAFFGFWLSNLNIISLLIQLFVTRRVVGVFGVGTSLFFLPVGILLGAIGILITPALWMAVLIKIIDGSLKQSVNKAGMELMALPIPVEVKNQAKSFIDVFIDSLATGVGGFLLLVFTVFLDLSVSRVSFVMILIIVAWIFLITRVRKEYINSVRLKIEALKDDVKKEIPDLQNESVFGGLIKILQDGDEVQVMKTLRLIRDIQNDRLLPELRKLLTHPSREIRLEVLRMLYFYKHSYIEEAAGLIHDQDAEIKIEAFHYFFQHQTTERIDTLNSYLDDQDDAMRMAAFTCAARESRNNRQLKEILRIRERVEHEIRTIQGSHDRDRLNRLKIALARILGLANISELNPYLYILLNDRNMSVVRAAIEGAGISGNPEFIPSLIRMLTRKSMVEYTARSLALFQPQIYGILDDYLKNPQEKLTIRIHIPEILAKIGAQPAVDILLNNLSHQNPEIRYSIIHALYHLRLQKPDLKFDERRTADSVLDEVNNYIQFWMMIQNQLSAKASASEPTNIGKIRRQLIRDLERKLDDLLEVVFRLLGLKYPPSDITNAYLGLKSKKTDLRINAVEFLDNILDFDLKKVLIPLLESTVTGAVVEDTLNKLGLKKLTEYECMILLLTGEDRYLKMSALKLIAANEDDRYLSYIGKLVNNPEPIIRKTALQVIQKLHFTL